MNNNQINEFIKAVKKINTIQEVIILENNKNYFSNIDLSISILSKQPNFDKNSIDIMVKNIINDYNNKNHTNFVYNEGSNYHDIFYRIISDINKRLNKIFEDELNKFLLEKMVKICE